LLILLGPALIACKPAAAPDPSSASAAPASAATTAPRPGAAKTLIDYSVEGTPDPATDQAIGAVTPNKNIEDFRRFELHPPGDERAVSYEEQKEINGQQRLRFFLVARDAPQFLTPQDIAWAQYEENVAISNDCDDQSNAGTPTASLTASVCKKAHGDSEAGAKVLEADRSRNAAQGQ